MRKKQTMGSMMLLITSIIWGCAFVAQKVGDDYLGPFSFTGIRFLLSAIFLIVIVCVRDLLIYKKLTLFKMEKKKRNTVILGGVLCGIALFLASNLQQYSMHGTSVGKSSFITALYIVLVPILGLFIKKKVKIIEWISVLFAMISLVLLCFKKEESGINIYDFGLLGCALFFSIQILLIDHFSKDNDCMLMAMIQFIVCGSLSCILMLIFEKPTTSSINDALIPLLYAGLASGGIAYTLQFTGQKYTNPVVASVIMSLEAVVGLIAGAIIIHERLSNQELIGCLMMFLAIIIAQIPFDKFNKKKNPQIS